MGLSEEHKKNLSKARKKLYAGNPNLAFEQKEKLVKFWSNKEERNAHSYKMKKFYEDNPDKKAWGNISNEGRKFSDEHKKKISEALKRYCRNNPKKAFKSRSEANKGKIPWNKGVSTPKDVKKKISESNKKYLKEHPEVMKERSGPHQFWSSKNHRWIGYRSSYELAAYNILESMKMVVSYESEPFSIPYCNGYNNVSYYFPDILVKYRNGEEELIEVKPLGALEHFKNKRKFNAARRYCNKNGIEFSIWTEDQVFNKNIRKPFRREPVWVQ